MTPELKQEIESARELARTGDYNEHPCEIGYAETIVDLADRIEQLEAEVKTVLHREAETTRRYDAKIDALEAEIARKDEALSFAYSWLDRWATHIGMCQGGQVCMCGLTRLRFDITAALETPHEPA